MMAALEDIEEDIGLPEGPVISPVKRIFTRLKRKGEQARTIEVNCSHHRVSPDKEFDDSDGIELHFPVGNEERENGGNGSTGQADGSNFRMEFDDDGGIEGQPGNYEEGSDMDDNPDEQQECGDLGAEGRVRHKAGLSDDEDADRAAFEESDEEEQLARMLAQEGESESEGEGGASEDGSNDGGNRRKRARTEQSERDEKNGEGSEAEADELDFDRDRDEDENEGPSQPDVLLKKHKRRRDGGEEDIHAESQRLLRETRGVSFKTQSTVQKPLSSLLEKIRKRKEELFRARQPPPERRPNPVWKPLSDDALNNASKRRRRIGESSDEEDGDDDDSDDDMLLQILTKEKATKAPAGSSRERSPGKEPVEEDAKQNGYEGDMEKDDEELTFDFRKKAPDRPEEPFRPPVADTQDLFTEPQADAVDGFVEEDKEGEKVAPQKEKARPVFSIFNRKKVAKVPKFSESFRMPVEDTQHLFSDPQFDDEPIEPPAKEGDQDRPDAPEEASEQEKEGRSDVEDDVMPSKMKLTMDNSKSQPSSEPWELDRSEDGHQDEEKDEEKNEENEEEKEEEKEAKKEKPCPAVPLSPKKKTKVSDAVRRFVDDEAEEEDSDGNLGNLSDDDEDPAAAADMEYIIDTRAEAVIDNGEKERLALHRQWAEQQDMKDTKELLDRMKNGWQRPGATGALLDSDDEDDLDMTPDILRRRRLRARAAARAREEAFDDYGADPAANEDEHSDGDGPGFEDEDFREQVLRRRRLQESESLEPEPLDLGDDEASREVLGLIKRATVPTAGPVNPPLHKEKAHGGLLGLFSKKNKALKSSSSFLNRASSSSKDGTGNVTTANAGSGTGRYYIFGRDDNNSGMGFDRKEQGDKESEKASDLSNPSVSRAPTNFAGIASRVGAVGLKKSAPLGAMAPSKFFGLLSKGARPEVAESSMLPAEVPSFLREFRPAKKSAFVR